MITMLVVALQGAMARPAIAMTITASTGECLDVRGGSFANHTPLQTRDCNGTSAQQFWFPSDFPYAKRPYNSSLAVSSTGTPWCVDMPYSSDGSPTWISECRVARGQRWEIANASVDIADGDAHVLTPPAGTSQWIPVGGPWPNWSVAALTYTRNNELRLSDGRCLDVPWSTADHTKVVANQCHGGANQQWYPQSGKGIVGLGGSCLTVPIGTRGYLEMRPCTGAAGQRLRFRGGLRGDANKCLTTERDPRDAQSVFVRTCDGSAEQRWTIDLFERP
jgi:hypothetical protein